ncbi:MAG: NADH-quinone oxidoreductase subunit C [Fibrobacterota bacterium]
MAKEEEIQQALVRQYPALEGHISIQRPRRMWIQVEASGFIDFLEYLVKEQEVIMCCTITGLDKGETLAAIYHLARPDGIIFNVEINVPKSNPVIQSITPTYPSADLYERELIDLLGMKVEGLGEGFRYPLTDDWPKGQYPLRKDWKLDPAIEIGHLKEL